MTGRVPFTPIPINLERYRWSTPLEEATIAGSAAEGTGLANTMAHISRMTRHASRHGAHTGPGPLVQWLDWIAGGSGGTN